jgi:hypothetical protein
MRPDAELTRWWNGVALESAAEVGRTTLGGVTVKAMGHDEVVPPGCHGALVALAAERESLEIGVFCSPEGCRGLAALMMGMEPEDDEMTVDAVSELVNVLAGMTKRRLPVAAASYNIGLPLFVKGAVEVLERVERSTARLQIGEVEANLVVMRTAHTTAHGGSDAHAQIAE